MNAYIYVSPPPLPLFFSYRLFFSAMSVVTCPSPPPFPPSFFVSHIYVHISHVNMCVGYWRPHFFRCSVVCLCAYNFCM